MKQDINKVLSGQSFLDKVIELTGDIENAFEMALVNQMSITDDLQPGIKLQSVTPINESVTVLFHSTFRLATNLNVTLQNELNHNGIGFMIIEENFIVQ